MKSILQEANSIERAIDKAWNEAGKPKEFTIKVLDEGERNFLGLSRRPAIVSIIFKPEKASIPTPVRKEERVRDDRRDKPRDNSPRRIEPEQLKVRRYAGTDEQRAAFHRTQAEGWSEEWQEFVLNELRELLKRMGISTEMHGSVTGDKVFTIAFKKALLDNDDEQRMLFATFSYLAIQLLKRQYKSRFVGYRIAVTGPKADGSSMSADSDEPASAMSAPRPTEQREARPPRDRDGGGERRDRDNNGGRENRDRGGRDRGERNNDRGERRPRFERPTQPRVQESLSNDDDILADQMRFAQQQLNSEDHGSHSNEHKPAPAPAVKPLKKDQKYQPFFVIEDEKSTK